MRRLIASAMALLALPALVGCTQTSYAASLVERTAIAIADDVTPPYPEPRDAEFLAGRAVAAPRLPSTQVQVDYDVEVLGWEGNSGDEVGATFELRISAHVLGGVVGSGFTSESYEEETSTRCYEFTIYGFRNYDTDELREFTCDPEVRAIVPSAEALEAYDFDENAEQLLLEAVTGATASDVDDRVRDRFPHERYIIESAEEDGVLVLALGITDATECMVAVRHPDGSVERVGGWNPEALQPGETGCSPDLYLHPAL